MPTKTSPRKRTAAVKGNTPVPSAKAKTERTPREPKKLNECRCGCGAMVKGVFAQGHDARLYGQVLRGEKPESLIADQPGLMSKLTFARTQADRKATAKADRQAAAAKAKAEAPQPDQAAPSPDPEATPTPKVRRKPSRVSG
jgi:hypothetical protein